MKDAKRLWVCLFFLGGISALGQGPDGQTLGKRWWGHVQYLADDKLEGRDTGSEGFEKAAAYVIEQFKNAGLQPAGVNGFAQPVEFDVAQLEESRSSLELLRDGKTEAVKFGDEAFFVAGKNVADSVEAEAVFVGYGFAVPELSYDDFAGQNLKGKLAVFLTGGPATMPGPIKSHFQSSEERRKALAKAGAIGYAVIPNPKSAEVPWSRTAGARFLPKMELVEAGGTAAPSPKVVMVINPEHAEEFFIGSGHSFKEVLEASTAEKPLPHFPLAGKIRAKIGVKRWQIKSENLAGVLPGGDAVLGKETVVISAHLDHLGIGEAVNGDKIYNGAMDDASGIASLLEVARAMKESGAKPKRSIMFLAVTAEEKGLLGSEYFAKHPTVDAKSIVADLNMDMFLPLFSLKYLEVQGLGESTLGDDIRAVCETTGIQVQADKQPDHNRFIRSDQYSFIRQGVPALAFKFGWLPGTPEEKLFNDWYKERYHGPADDVNQPVDLEGAAQFNAILGKLALRVANAAQRPQWKAESFFKRYAQ
jgi:Zn-dependent M28 family amino/carboxypeptidase